MKKITVTLSRAHKVLERIAISMNTLNDVVIAADLKVILRSKPSAEQMSLLNSRVEKVTQALTQLDTFSKAYETLRKIIGRANVEVGISDLLARVETNRRAIALYGSVSQTYVQRPDHVQIADLDSFNWASLNNNTNDGGIVQRSIAASVTVTAAPKTWGDEFATKKQQLEVENFKLLDKLADLNGKTITFELEEDLVTALGL
jgi:hypothetical protein